MRPLIGKEWDTETQNEDVWEGSGEAVNTEPLNSAEPSVPVEAALYRFLLKRFTLICLKKLEWPSLA